MRRRSESQRQGTCLTNNKVTQKTQASYHTYELIKSICKRLRSMIFMWLLQEWFECIVVSIRIECKWTFVHAFPHVSYKHRYGWNCTCVHTHMQELNRYIG